MQTIHSLKATIIRQIPNIPLEDTGFCFGRYDKQKKLHRLEPETVMQLEKAVGRGRLLIVMNGLYSF